MNIEIRNICIGDWCKVYYESYRRFEIERLTAAHFKTHTLLNNIYPIRLTPKVLESIGFKKVEEFYEMAIGNWTIQSDCKHIRGFVSPSNDFSDGFIHPCFELPCEYLHEVQRIFRLACIGKTWEEAPKV